MLDFRQRFQDAIDRSEFSGSLRQLSIEADCGEKWLSNTLKNQDLDTSKTGPGFFALSRVCAILDFSLDELSGLTTKHFAKKEASQVRSLARLATDALADDSSVASPSPQALMRRYIKSGGRIEAFHETLHYAVQYELLERQKDSIKVLDVGTHSLPAVTMNTSKIRALQAALDALEGTLTLRDAKRDFLAAKERGSLSVTKQLDEPIPNLPVHVRMDYIATYLQVTDASGDKSILAYTSLII